MTGGHANMEVKNCKECGRLFNYMGGAPLCDGCRKKLEQKFQEVKQYLDENPNASVNQVSEDNDVSVNRSSSGSVKRDFHFQKLHLTVLPASIAADRSGRGAFAKSVKRQWQIHSQTRVKNQSL